MYKWSALITGAVVVAALAGCGGSKPAPAPAAEAEAAAPAVAVEAPVVVEAAPVEAMPAEAPAVETAPASEAAAEQPAPAAPADDLHQKLIGTKWKLGDIDVHFKDAETVHLNGGPLTMMTAGKGLDAKYAYSEGGLRVNAMGQSKTGTWDGTSLTVDGEAGVKVE